MTRSPEDYIRAIDRAVRQDNFRHAADLAFEAFESYPNSEKIRRYARVFAPKTLVFHELPPNPEMSLNFELGPATSQQPPGPVGGTPAGRIDFRRRLPGRIGNPTRGSNAIPVLYGCVLIEVKNEK
jgi:hypothetical protein